MTTREFEFPGPRLPSAVQSAWWAARPVGFLRHCRREHGDRFAVRLTDGGRWVFVSHPEDARAIFTRAPAAIESGSTHERLEPLFGARSVHLNDGADHLRQRRLLLPLLQGAYLQRYAGLVVETTERELARWPLGEEFPVLPRVQRITLEVIMRGVFGFAAGEGRRVRECVETMLRLTMGEAKVVAAALLTTPLFRLATGSRLFAFRRTMDALESALLAEIAGRRRETGCDSRRDLLSMLLAAQEEGAGPLDDAEIKDNLVTLLVAGHETTATSLSWALHTLARSPRALEQLVGELDSDARLEATVREVLRLHPSVPLAMRRLTEPLELRDATLPAGTNVAVAIYLLQRSPLAYDRPDAFLPERFESGRPDSYAWAPFGGGVRRCLGAGLATLELKLVLRTVLAQRDLAVREDREEAVASLALRPARGARITLGPRRRPGPR